MLTHIHTYLHQVQNVLLICLANILIFYCYFEHIFQCVYLYKYTYNSIFFPKKIEIKKFQSDAVNELKEDSQD